MQKKRKRKQRTIFLESIESQCMWNNCIHSFVGRQNWPIFWGFFRIARAAYVNCKKQNVPNSFTHGPKQACVHVNTYDVMGTLRWTNETHKAWNQSKLHKEHLGQHIFYIMYQLSSKRNNLSNVLWSILRGCNKHSGQLDASVCEREELLHESPNVTKLWKL